MSLSAHFLIMLGDWDKIGTNLKNNNSCDIISIYEINK